MARLVYLPSVCDKSWLLWTVAGQGSCLRDYRFSPLDEKRQHSTADIQAMLNMPGHYWEMARNETYKNGDFWREEISFKNQSMSLDPITNVMEGANGHRLQSLFSSRIKPLLADGPSHELERFIGKWISGFSHVVERDQFNHWDNSDASEYQNINYGSSWTLAMLEYCRSTDELGFVSTGEQFLDFGLFAAEVCFGISSRNNPFQEGRQNSIQPDGLGLRRDRSIVVFEMKGPHDDHDPFTAMLQALCGALAVTAKRDWIVKTAESEGNRRPSIALAGVNNIAFSVNLYIAIVPKEGESISISGDNRVGDSISRIKAAFPQLGDVVFFVPSRSQFNQIGQFRAELVYR